MIEKWILPIVILLFAGCSTITVPDVNSIADASPQERNDARRVLSDTGRATPREKLLLRSMLQTTIYETAVQMGKSDPEVAEFFRTHKSLEARLEAVANSGSGKMKRAAVYSLGSPYSGEYRPAKVVPALTATLRTEEGRWLKLDIAVVLSSFGDDSGKAILVAAYEGRDGYRTSSESEVGTALIPLLLLDYEFPNGFAAGRRDCPWPSGFSDYLQELEKQNANNTPEDIRR